MYGMEIPVNFKARHYQARALRALERGAKLVVLCWSRRAGKDFTCFGYAVKKMVEQPMNVVLVFPTKEQGRKAFWDNVENDGFKTIEHIPKSLIARQDNTEMKITLLNGSTFSLVSGADADSLRGANGKLYIFSEFPLIDSAAYDVVVPIVAVNGGQIIIQGTPKIDAISGGTFKILFQGAEKNPDQYASRITAEEYLDQETLDALRRDAIAKNGNDFFFRQEFLCDWGQASAATYYGQVLSKLESDKAIDLYPYNPAYPAYTAWDLGMADATAITFFQFYKINGKPTPVIIDYYETSSLANEAIVRLVQSKPYNLQWNFLPHDGSTRDSDAIPRIEKIRDYGLVNSSLLRREPIADGINRAMAWLAKSKINQPTTVDLIKKLYLYSRKFNPLTGDYTGPEHKSESHAADSIRYTYQAIELEFDQETCELYGSQAEESWSEETLVQTNFYSPA